MAAESTPMPPHDRVRHRPVLFELAHHGSRSRLLLADGDVNAFNAGALLIDDRVDCERVLPFGDRR